MTSYCNFILRERPHQMPKNARKIYWKFWIQSKWNIANFQNFISTFDSPPGCHPSTTRVPPRWWVWFVIKVIAHSFYVKNIFLHLDRMNNVHQYCISLFMCMNKEKSFFINLSDVLYFECLGNKCVSTTRVVVGWHSGGTRVVKYDFMGDVKIHISRGAHLQMYSNIRYSVSTWYMLSIYAQGQSAPPWKFFCKQYWRFFWSVSFWKNWIFFVFHR